MAKFTKFIPWVISAVLIVCLIVMAFINVQDKNSYNGTRKTYQAEKDSLLIELTLSQRNVEISQENIAKLVLDRADSNGKKEKLQIKLKVMTERRDYYKLKLNEVNTKIQNSVDSNGAANLDAIIESISD